MSGCRPKPGDYLFGYLRGPLTTKIRYATARHGVGYLVAVLTPEPRRGRQAAPSARMPEASGSPRSGLLSLPTGPRRARALGASGLMIQMRVTDGGIAEPDR